MSLTTHTIMLHQLSQPSLKFSLRENKTSSIPFTLSQKKSRVALNFTDRSPLGNNSLSHRDIKSSSRRRIFKLLR